MKHVGILMSAGSGKRMGTDIPKQYLELVGKPVLYYSLKAMQDSFLDEIIIVASKEYFQFIKEELVDKYSFSKVGAIVEGGAERSDSVYNGLLAVSKPESSYVYIHDGARPMLSGELLQRAKEDAECFGSSVMGVRSKDTVKLVDDDGFVASTLDRSFVWNIQTPQTFVGSDLLKAYEIFRKKEGVTVTDDSSVMELFGTLPVHITLGDYKNIKITTPEDLKTVEKFL